VARDVIPAVFVSVLFPRWRPAPAVRFILFAVAGRWAFDLDGGVTGWIVVFAVRDRGDCGVALFPWAVCAARVAAVAPVEEEFS
jgi:hypothetical protein